MRPLRPLLDIARAIAHPGRGRATEWLSALALTSWGIVLLDDGETFRLASYRGLRLYADEGTWGAICLVVGLTGLVALAVNGRLPQGSPVLRAACSGFRVLFWGNIAFGFLYAALATGLPSTALAIYPWLMLFDVIACHRAASDARAAAMRRAAADPDGRMRVVLA